MYPRVTHRPGQTLYRRCSATMCTDRSQRPHAEPLDQTKAKEPVLGAIASAQNRAQQRTGPLPDSSKAESRAHLCGAERGMRSHLKPSPWRQYSPVPTDRTAQIPALQIGEHLGWSVFRSIDQQVELWSMQGRSPEAQHERLALQETKRW